MLRTAGGRRHLVILLVEAVEALPSFLSNNFLSKLRFDVVSESGSQNVIPDRLCGQVRNQSTGRSQQTMAG